MQIKKVFFQWSIYHSGYIKRISVIYENLFAEAFKKICSKKEWIALGRCLIC